MQKTLLYIFFLLLFGGGVYYFVFNKKEAAFAASEAEFRIKDTASIGAIFLSVPSGQSILLNRTDSGWMLNKQYPVLEQTMNTLLMTLYRQEPIYPTPEAAHNRIVTQLAGNGIKVEVYNRSNEKMKTFYVGTEVQNYEGTTMLLEGAERPYVVRISSYSGVLTSRYSVDMSNWRSRTLIDLKQSDIKSVTLNYPSQPLNSFTVNHNDGKIDVKADPDAVGTMPMNERRVKLFLDFFENLTCEGYLNGEVGLDSIISTLPKKCELSITSKEGKQQRLDIYWMPQTQRSKNVDTTRNKEVPSGYDVDRYYAVGNNYKDTMLIQEYTFNKVFRKAYEFYQKDKELDVIGLDKKE